MTAKQTKQIWCNLIDEKFKGEAEYYGAIVGKLKRLKFAYDKPKHGKHNSGLADDPHCIYCYARKHFPALLRLFKVKLQAAEIPARQNRTRLEHHSPKQDQLRLDRGNQLNLFK
ncbi:MAG: hypothetical protein KAS87_01495 [Candidatus Omnitrophica bacterium]|nr:hypothetical protein [Candidatus Omnitrophota bacterium]